jgi:hypothetical protein
MTNRAKETLTLTAVALLGLAMIFDLHRIFFRWAFPIITDYLDWLVR